MAVRIEAAPTAPMQSPTNIAPQPQGPVRAHPPYLLLADDDAAEASALAELLRKELIACDVVKSAEDALKAFTARDYDMVLMNLRGPIQWSLDAVQAIRKMERSLPEPRVPVFILTKDVSEAERKVAQNADVDDVLVRTTDVAELAAIVERTFEVERRTPPEMIPREPLQFARLLEDASGSDAAAEARADEFAGLYEVSLAALKAAVSGGDLAGMRKVAEELRDLSVRFGAGRVRRFCLLLLRISIPAHLADMGAEYVRELEFVARDLTVWRQMRLGRVLFQARPAPKADAPAVPVKQRTAVKLYSFLKKREDVFSKAQ